MVALANHCDENGGNCYPSQEVIQALTELSMDTIQRQLGTLTTGEYITRKKRPAVRDRWASWGYEINLSKLVDQTAPCGPEGSDQAALWAFLRWCPTPSDGSRSCHFPFAFRHDSFSLSARRRIARVVRLKWAAIVRAVFPSAMRPVCAAG
jgi:hypothetical protein